MLQGADRRQAVVGQADAADAADKQIALAVFADGMARID